MVRHYRVRKIALTCFKQTWGGEYNMRKRLGPARIKTMNRKMTYALIEELSHVHKAPIEQLQVEAKEFEKTFKAHYGISGNTSS